MPVRVGGRRTSPRAAAAAGRTLARLAARGVARGVARVGSPAFLPAFLPARGLAQLVTWAGTVMCGSRSGAASGTPGIAPGSGSTPAQ